MSRTKLARRRKKTGKSSCDSWKNMVKYYYSNKKGGIVVFYLQKNMKLADEWKEYKILDMADGQKLEKWGNVILSRPDPQIIWKQKSYPEKWKPENKESYFYHQKSAYFFQVRQKNSFSP